MAAYRRAIELGVDYIEIDMRRTKDGQYVSVHNSTVDAKSNGVGRVDSFTLEEIRWLDAGSWFDARFAGERVPLVSEVFELMSGKAGAYVDVKDAEPADVVRYLREFDMVESSVIYASPDELAAMLEIEPRVRPLPEYPGTPEAVAGLVRKVPTETIAISSYVRISKEAVDACHAAGAKAYADIMAHDHPGGWQYALECGMDGLQTDKPTALMKWLGR